MNPLCLLALAMFASLASAADFPPAETLPVSPELPDPLRMLDGSRVASKEDWLAKRAPELRALFAHYMYGQSPASAAVTGKVLRSDPAAFGGKATLKEVEVSMGLEAPVHLLVVVPNQRTKAVPCFLGINFYGNYVVVHDPLVQMPSGWVPDKYAGAEKNRAGEVGRGQQAEAWAIEQSIDRGYAVATFFTGDIVPDDAALAAARLARIAPAGGTTERGDVPGTLMAWAWGFSRMIDYLKTEPAIDAQRIAVVGHSRNGKAALLAAAYDARIALCIPSQAGSGGTGPSRVAAEWAVPQANGRPKAETVAVINKNFPHWFCANFKAFGAQPERLPFDQHALVALCAPRPVLMSTAVEDLWSNPPGQFAMLMAADPVFKLVAGDGLAAGELPPVGQLVDSRLGWFMRPGKHSMAREDWSAWLNYADKWLR